VSSLEKTVSAILPPDPGREKSVRARLDSLTKPLGSLGRLEDLAARVAVMTGADKPSLARKAVIVMAADHGVAAEGVSAYPPEVTRQMVLNFLNGGAAINVLARHAGARVVVVDAGVSGEPLEHPALVSRRIGNGTSCITRGPAMTRAEAVKSVESGIAVLEEEAGKGLDAVCAGDMGIGNTTPSSVITAAFTGKPPEDVTGRGTGVDDEALAWKVSAVKRALETNRPDPADPLGVLASVGGFEIGGMAGVMLAAAARRIPVVVDGFISGAAALIAAGLVPLAKEYMFAGHCSTEPGHRAILAHLGLRPVLDLEMRLGEGTGAILALGVLEAAVKLMNEMATFGEAGVSEKGKK